MLEPTYESDHTVSPGKRKWKKCGDLLRFFFRSPKSCHALLRLVRRNGYRGGSALSHAANIAQKLSVYNHADFDYVIFDQGLTQSALSLSHTGKIPVGENEAAVYALCNSRSVRKIYLHVDREEALRRMAGRDTNDSRIEKMRTPEERRAALAVWENMCEKIPYNLFVENREIDESVSEILKESERTVGK